MKSPLSVLIVFLFAITSCSDHIKTTTASKDPIHSTSDKSASDFQEYLNTLEQIPLPFTHNSFVPIEALSKKYHKNRFKQFKHHGSTVPLGILFKDRKTVVLIDISDDQLGVPFLTTYDRKGSKIDSLALYPKTRQDFRNNVICLSKAYFTIIILKAPSWTPFRKLVEFLQNHFIILSARVIKHTSCQTNNFTSSFNANRFLIDDLLSESLAFREL
jgi:hypothetical protein